MKRGRLRLGYPCVNLSIKNSKQSYMINQTTLLKFTNSQQAYNKLLELAIKNLQGLEHIIDWNYMNNIHFYRIGSGLFSHIANPKLDKVLGKELSIRYRQMKDFKNLIKKIGNKIYQYKIRVSFHPDQFINLGSPNESVIKTSIMDLKWHAHFVDLLIEGAEGKSDDIEKFYRDTVFIIHGGGAYGDKKLTLKRWAKTYQNLPENIKKRIVIENDERSYNPMDLIEMCEQNLIPICIDFFHQECYELIHPDEETCDYSKILPRVRQIWIKREMTQKFHYSRQQPEKRLGAHSHYCDEIPQQILDLQDQGANVDCMLECKSKDLSLLKTTKIYKDRILKQKINKNLIKSLNDNEIPQFEYNTKQEINKQLVGIQKTMTPEQRHAELKNNKEDSKKKLNSKKVIVNKTKQIKKLTTKKLKKIKKLKAQFIKFNY